MILPKLAVSRPVATLMFFLGVCLLGFISWFKLPQDLFPDVSYPQITIVTSYSNAAPEEVENLITKPIEESVSTLSGLKKIKSISKEGLSIVTIEFDWNLNMDSAAMGVRQKIDLIKERLPRECHEPIVKKMNPFELPVLILSVAGKDKSLLLPYCKKILKDKLAKVSGVASVIIQGGEEKEIFVDVDASMLRSRNIDITKIGKILRDSNLNYPAGTTKEDYYEYLIRTQGEFKSIKEIGNTILSIDMNKRYSSSREDNEQLIGALRLKDIAEITSGFSEKTNISRFNGNDNILISIYKQSDANTIKTVFSLKEKLNALKIESTADINVDIVYDKSSFIKNAINGVTTAGLQGAILAFLVLLVILQSFSTAFIVAISIPVSILAAFILMYFNGITINIMSLGGLALGIGMLVDSSVVVIENIFRKKSEGIPLKKATVDGASQVGGAIAASTLTTIAVFLPMIFLTGIEGQFFKELALTVTFALLASLLVSLTLIPRLISTPVITMPVLFFLKKCSYFISWSEEFYVQVLEKFLKNRYNYLMIIFVVFIVSVAMMFALPREVMPLVDEGQFGIMLEMPAGTRIDITDKEVKKVESILLQNNNVKNISINIGSRKEDALDGAEILGSHQARITVVLKKDRLNKTLQVISLLRKKLDKNISETVHLEFITNASGISGFNSTKTPLSIKISSKDNDKLNQTAKEVVSFFKGVKGIIDLKTTLSEPSPETRIVIDKDKASFMGISAQDISIAAGTAIKGVIATKFKDNKGFEIPVRVRLAKEFRDDLSSIENIPLWTSSSTTVFLGDVVKIHSGVGPSEILRIDQQKVVLITADISNDVSKKKVLSSVRDLLNIISDKDDDVDISFMKSSIEQKDSFKELMFSLFLSVLLVYMIMAAQFESFIHPLLIMVTVPLGLIGVNLGLWMTGTSLNVVSVLGIILLGGIVVNNGIVLIEYINQMRVNNSDVLKAVLMSCRLRFRPIIMTTTTTILGLVPLAFSLGDGSEFRSPLAVSVMSGLLVSTCLTLLVLPAMYLLSEKWIQKRQ